MTTDTALPSTGDQFGDALLRAVAASAADREELLQSTRSLPHTAYTGQLNAATAARVRASVTIPDQVKARTSLYLGFLTEEQWDQAAAALTSRPEALAALMSGRVHPDLLDPAHTAGHALVPAVVGFECSGHPPTGRPPKGRLCEHSAILAHALVGRLRTQPSALLTIRGCSLGRLTAKIRTALTRSHPPADGTGGGGVAPSAEPLLPTGTAVGSVRADDAYSLWSATADQPATAPAASIPAPGYRLPTPPPGVSPGIASMVTTAAQRAQDVLRGAAVEELDPLTDAARHLSTPGGAPLLEAVASRLGRHPAEVRSLVLAYRHGGPAGVRVADGPLPADGETVERAVAAIIAAQPTARGSLRASGNQVTSDSAEVQLRLGPDGRWYPFAVGLAGGWQPVPGPSHDPVAAYRAARTVRLAGSRRSHS